jgi:glycosyltransferase A (GT-A) superfamily protein (DUF2064 family)
MSLSGVEVAVMCPESDEDELAHRLGNRMQVVAQKGQGLAAALTSVFRHFTARGQRQVVAFNSDSPHLPAAVLDRAFQRLSTSDVVIGPTHDGGYYLVGAKAAHPALFGGDEMGTRSALDRLLARTRVLQLSTSLTESFYDIDVADDLMQLARELQLAPASAPRTAAWFAQWEHAVEQLRHRTGGL